MIILRTFRMIVAVMLCGFATSASAADSIPACLDGSMMPYGFSESAGGSSTLCPDSLTPFHIEYVARHGARYLSSQEKTRRLTAMLTSQQRAGNLTPRGEAMLALLGEVNALCRGRWGALSPIGYSEERQLGRRMLRDWPAVFGMDSAGRPQGRPVRIKAVSSYVPRVVASMYSFCHAMAAENSWLEISASEGREYSPLVRFFSTDKAYADWLRGAGDENGRGGWQEPVRRFERQMLPSAPAHSLFRRIPSELQKGNERATATALGSLSLEMYGVLQALPAMGLASRSSEFMTEEEYRRCWECVNYSQYLKRTWTSQSQLPAEAARPLRDSILSGIGRAVLLDSLCHTPDIARRSLCRAESGGEPVAMNAYFGHAETLMPLVSLMRLPGYCDQALDSSQVADWWRNWQVVPLAANLTIVVARSDTGRYYAAVWLNSRLVFSFIPISDFLQLVGSLK